MRANREQSDHGTENASSCSRPNGDPSEEEEPVTTTRLETLTQEQLDRLPAIRDEWIAHGLRTGAADRPMAEEGITEVYANAGFAKPEFVWVDSPFAGAKMAMEWGGSPGHCAYGQHRAGWLAFFAALEEFGVDIGNAKPFIKIGKSCGWWWPFEFACIVSERPTELHLDPNGRLHNTTGPATAFADGEALYFVRGLAVPDEWITKRDELDPKLAWTHENAEMRRCVAEILGWDKLVAAAGAKVIKRDKYGSLLECSQFQDDNGQPARFVRVKCTTTGRIYLTRVPPDARSPRHALGWRYMDPAQMRNPNSAAEVPEDWYKPDMQS